MKKVTFIWHDGFIYEDEENVLIFDYWKENISNSENKPYFLSNINRDKNIFIFISHHHKDHYNKEVFEWEKLFPSIKFIVSKDVAKFSRHVFNKNSYYNGYKPKPDNVIIMDCDNYKSIKDLEIFSFGSTDIGNSYAVKIKNFTIFHAGDLNAWTWRDESTQQEIESELMKYNLVIKTISVKFNSFDVVMFPIDPRIGSKYYEGAEIFLEKFKVNYFFPMHFCLYSNEKEKYDFFLKVSDFINYKKSKTTEFIFFNSPYSCFGFE